MNDKDKAMRLALDALEYDGFTPEDFGHKKLCELAKASLRSALAYCDPSVFQLLNLLESVNRFSEGLPPSVQLEIETALKAAKETNK